MTSKARHELDIDEARGTAHAVRETYRVGSKFAKFRSKQSVDATDTVVVPPADSPQPGLFGKTNLRKTSAHADACPAFPEPMTLDCKRVISDSKSSDGAVKVTFGVWSQAGVDVTGQEKENQDAWAVHAGLGGAANIFFGVFDGHGQDGAKAARFVARTLARTLNQDPAFKAEKFSEAVTSQHLETNRLLWHAPGINIKFSGTTAVTAVLQPRGRLLIANVGDSAALLGRIDPSGRQVTAEALTTEHTPENAEEAERIKASGGRISPYAHEGVGIGPLRIWLADEDVPGLSMTRAFGDSVAARVGLRPKPEIRQILLTPEDRYLLLMSDGITEFTDEQELLNLVHQRASAGESALDIAKFLVEDAREKWRHADEGGPCIDDCTVIVAILEVPPLVAVDAKFTTPGKAGGRQRRAIEKMQSGMNRLTMAATAQALSKASRMIVD